MKVLVVEGDARATEDAVAALERTGQEIVRGLMRDDAKQTIHAHDGQFVALVAVPFQSWQLQILRDLRGWEHPPYCLTAAMEDADLVALLEAGADAGCLYPLSDGLFEAQIRAMVRRADKTAGEPLVPEVIRIRDLLIDNARYEVRFTDAPLPVTPAEFRILAALGRRPGKVVPTTTLFREALGYDVSAQQAKDILKVHVRRIRNKIRDAGGSTDYIWNIRGFGYLLERRSQQRGDPVGSVEEEEEVVTE